jgi:hypothetical protein
MEIPVIAVGPNEAALSQPWLRVDRPVMPLHSKSQELSAINPKLAGGASMRSKTARQSFVSPSGSSHSM